jgi:hypothetical protein
VYRKRRANLSDEPRDAEVCDDDGIRPCAVYIAAYLLDSRELTVICKGVDRDVNLDTSGMTKSASFIKVACRKVLCQASGIEVAVAEVHCICPVGNRGAKCLR